jgi:DNA invertase Pin-like site-specific DNA recombinase
MISSSPSDPSNLRTPVRAAEYVRMSTEGQQYSIANQQAAIREYAAWRGFTIVRTYADEGKSGLLLQGRTGLVELLTDIQAERADYRAVLVYDVSRWGPLPGHRRKRLLRVPVPTREH